MSWFEKAKNWFQFIFGKGLKSYTIALILAASIAANLAVWKAYSGMAEKAGFAKTTVVLVKKHGLHLEQVEAFIDSITQKAKAAQNIAEEAGPLIAEGNVSAAKAKLTEARKKLDEIPGILEKINLDELKTELAAIRARVQTEPELASSLAVIEKNGARLKEIIAWKEEMLKATDSDMQRIEERMSALK